MIRKLGTALGLCSALVLGACVKELSTDPGPLNVDLTKARIRVANATNTPFGVALNGNTFLGGGNVAFGASACAFVDPANPQLSLQTVPTATVAAVPLPNFTLTLPALAANTDYSMVVYNVGTTPTAAIFEMGAYTPADTGARGIRVFNATNATIGAIDAHLIPTGGTISASTAKATNVAVGTVSAYFDVNSPTNLVRFARTAAPTTSLTYTAPTAGAFIFATGVTIIPHTNSTVVLAPAATGTGTRAFMFGGC